MTVSRIITQTISPSSLKTVFLSGCKDLGDLQVGVEWEKIGVLRESGEAIRYSGPRGVKTIFEAMEKTFGWVPDYSESGEPVALHKGKGAITLEPGGQIELSGQKAFTIQENASELLQHLKEIRQVSEPLGVAWLGIGAQPFSAHSEIEWVPKDRYRVMKKRLQRRGTKTYAMMKETASVQVSLDYTSEADAMFKFRLAMGLAPCLTALFANSPFYRGKRSPYLSRRADIWRHTDPERSGILWDVFKKNYTFDDYVNYALNVPALFILRDRRWIELPKMPFKQFLKNGWSIHSPEPEDWTLHLTTIFTEARLKNYLEIRSIDCQATDMGLAATAFLKGIFYDKKALEKAWGLIENIPMQERKRAWKDAPRHALNTRWGRGTLYSLAKSLLALSQAGLTKDDSKYLRPLEEMIRLKRCPAQQLLSCYEKKRGEKEMLRQVLRCAEI